MGHLLCDHLDCALLERRELFHLLAVMAVSASGQPVLEGNSQFLKTVVVLEVEACEKAGTPAYHFVVARI